MKITPLYVRRDQDFFKSFVNQIEKAPGVFLNDLIGGITAGTDFKMVQAQMLYESDAVIVFYSSDFNASDLSEISRRLLETPKGRELFSKGLFFLLKIRPCYLDEDSWLATLPVIPHSKKDVAMSLVDRDQAMANAVAYVMRIVKKHTLPG